MMDNLNLPTAKLKEDLTEIIPRMLKIRISQGIKRERIIHSAQRRAGRILSGDFMIKVWSRCLTYREEWRAEKER